VNYRLEGVVPFLRLLRLLAARPLVPLAHEIPVDDVEERRHVVRATVLVFEIVGVFPDIEASSGVCRRVSGESWFACLDVELLVRIDGEPRPAAAELAQGRLREFLLERRKLRN